MGSKIAERRITKRVMPSGRKQPELAEIWVSIRVNSWAVWAQASFVVIFSLAFFSCRAWHNGEPTVHVACAQFQNPIASFNHSGSGYQHYPEISLGARAQQFLQDNLRISMPHGAPSSLRYTSNITVRDADFARALAHSSQPYITWFFNNQIMAGAMIESQVLHLYKLYSNPNFLAYIKQLPGYDDHILSVYGRLINPANQRKKIFQEMGLKESIGLFNFFAKCAQEVRDKRAAHEQEYATRAQVAKLQQEELAHNSRKTELEQLKIELERQQRTTVSRPTATLAHCIVVWRRNQNGAHGARYKKRLGAVRELTDGKPPIKRIYKITDRDRDLIKELNLKKSDFVKLEGNELQHVLHREFIGITHAISDTRTLTVGSITGQSWIELLGSYLYTGMQVNKMGNCVQASKIADFCWAVTAGLGQIIIGAGEGIWQGGKNVVHMMQHPLDTAYGAGQAIGMLIIGCCKIIMATGDPDLPIDHEFSAFQRAHDPANAEYILRLYDGLMMQARQASCRDIACGISTAVTEALLTGALCSATAQCINSVGKRVPGAMQRVLGCVPEASESFALAEGGQVRFSKGALQALAESEVAEARAATLMRDGAQVEKLTIMADTVNQTGMAILKDGYYEVNGFRFTEFYYNRLWENGRSSPGFRAESVLRGAERVVPDPQGYAGFFRYEAGDWEMIFNPTTKVVSHLSKLKKR